MGHVAPAVRRPATPTAPCCPTIRAATAPTDADPFEGPRRWPASEPGLGGAGRAGTGERQPREACSQAYAFARTGYHRGLDALRRNGWRGAGLVPWEHEPNQGFLRAVWALAQAARAIGETAEYDRCVQLLVDSSPTGYAD